jgi:hypothetical protein
MIREYKNIAEGEHFTAEELSRLGEELRQNRPTNVVSEAPQYMYSQPHYVKGTIKLTWIEPDNVSIMFSQMFETLDEALKNTQGKKDWLIFTLKEAEGNSYKWELLPYGESKNYINSMKVNNFVEEYGIYVLIGLGALILLKK